MEVDARSYLGNWFQNYLQASLGPYLGPARDVCVLLLSDSGWGRCRSFFMATLFQCGIHEPAVFPPVFFNHGAATCLSNRDEVVLCDLNPVGPLRLVQPGGWSLTCITREGIGVNVTLLLPQSLAVCSNPLAEFFRLPWSCLDAAPQWSLCVLFVGFWGP